MGARHGGRQPGTPNRRTVEAQERLAELGCDPLEGMARIAMDPATPLQLRARMYAELAPYIYPRRRPVADEPDRGIDFVAILRRTGELLQEDYAAAAANHEHKPWGDMERCAAGSPSIIPGRRCTRS